MEESHGIIDDLLHELKMGPEVLTPSQYFDARQTQDPFLPERRLIAAAFRSHLEDWRVAHLDWRLHPSPTRRAQWVSELTDWLNSDSEMPLSFAWYCDVLKLNVDAVRARVFAHEVGRVDQLHHISTNQTVIKAEVSRYRNGRPEKRARAILKAIRNTLKSSHIAVLLLVNTNSISE